MATVLMFGRPPPAKPYRHPASARDSALATAAPDRGIERRRRVHRDHRELKTGRALREIDASAGRHLVNVELRAAARQDLASLPPLRLEHARATRRLPVVERVLAPDESPQPHAAVHPPSPPPPPSPPCSRPSVSRAEHRRIGRRGPHDPEARPQHPHPRHERAEILLRLRPNG